MLIHLKSNGRFTVEKVAIISIIYNELSWADTERCIDKCDCPKFFVDRHGVGSLAKAINAGFRQWGPGFEFIWFVTNVTFSQTCLKHLVRQMEMDSWAGLTPCFESDHLFCRPNPQKAGSWEAPFIEFTAPIVRASVFRDYPLDENMPYWGHDLDWGHRIRQGGYKLGCFYGEQLGHSYIRNTDGDKWTKARCAKRKATDHSPRAALIKKYGPDWRKVLKWPS
jgi:hypothetical protein